MKQKGAKVAKTDGGGILCSLRFLRYLLLKSVFATFVPFVAISFEGASKIYLFGIPKTLGAKGLQPAIRAVINREGDR